MYYEVYRWWINDGKNHYWAFFRTCDTIEEALFTQQVLEYKRGYSAKILTITPEA